MKFDIVGVSLAYVSSIHIRTANQIQMFWLVKANTHRGLPTHTHMYTLHICADKVCMNANVPTHAVHTRAQLSSLPHCSAFTLVYCCSDSLSIYAMLFPSKCSCLPLLPGNDVSLRRENNGGVGGATWAWLMGAYSSGWTAKKWHCLPSKQKI